MEELKDIDKASPEQIKEVSKLLSKARINLFFITLKAMIILFGANLATFSFGRYFLVDTDPEMLAGFNVVGTLLNSIFIFIYLNGLLKANSAMVVEGIKAVLKKKEE